MPLPDQALMPCIQMALRSESQISDTHSAVSASSELNADVEQRHVATRHMIQPPHHMQGLRHKLSHLACHAPEPRRNSVSLPLRQLHVLLATTCCELMILEQYCCQLQRQN